LVFVPEEWGGANETHLLKNGRIGVLGHIASFDSQLNKHYYSMVFSLNPETCEKTPMKIIAARSDFPRGPGKRPDLEDPRAILQATTSDTGVQPVIIQNIQRETLTNQLLHIDFHHVNMNVSMDSKVTIHFLGESVGVKSGGVLQVELYEVEVRCMPDHLPPSMEVDISGLAMGDQLLVSDLIFRDGIEVLTDPSTVLIQIKTIHDEVDEEVKEVKETA
jgi:large subunit ribosomal protein L25